MDKVIEVFDNVEGVIKPEIIFYYGACAVLITIFVNWTLSTLLVVVKPLTCAGVVIAFLRPDLVQGLLNEELMRLFAEKIKTAFFGFLRLILYIGEQLRSKLI